MLAQYQVAQYLLAEDLISAGCIVDCDFTISEVSRRNRNFKVSSTQGPSYLLKQGDGVAEVSTLAHEARIYSFLQKISKQDGFGNYLPRFVKYDDTRRILILELLQDAQDLHERQQQRNPFPTSVAVTLGRALSSLHSITASILASARNAGLKEYVPWVLSIHRPSVGIFHDTSNADLEIIRILQNTPAFGSLLDELRYGWGTDSLIHNDLKWDNCLVLRKNPSRARPVFKIIDWEFANLGDSCWDAGAVFAGYLGSWLLSIPVSGEEPPDRFLDSAKYPLEEMHPAIRAYWGAYVEGRCFNPAEAEEYLLRSVKYAAARLIQTAFEQMQRASTLAGSTICFLQMSLNILQRPHEAIVHLLGISPQQPAKLKFT